MRLDLSEARVQVIEIVLYIRAIIFELSFSIILDIYQNTSKTPILLL